MQYIDTPILVLGMLRPEDVNSLDQFVMHMYASTLSCLDGWVKQRDRLFLSRDPELESTESTKPYDLS